MVFDPKTRTIAYPAHKDGYIFSFYKEKLESIYEDWLRTNGLESAVTAFRATKENNVSLAKLAFDFIRQNPGCGILATDIEGFFDNINHQKLKGIWTRFLGETRLPDDHYTVWKALTHYTTVERHTAYRMFGHSLSRRPSADRICTPSEFREQIAAANLIRPHGGASSGIGIAQGSSLSPLLSNMYLADVDLAISQWARSRGGAYWRYCDDILIVVPRWSTPAVPQILSRELRKLGLKLSVPKTHRRPSASLTADAPLQYLGFSFDGNDVVVRQSSIHRYHRKLHRAVQAAVIRRRKEHRPGFVAPLRQRALYNGYSELPIRGTKIRARKSRQKYVGNFTDYLQRSGEKFNSPRIAAQREKVLKRFRTTIKAKAR